MNHPPKVPPPQLQVKRGQPLSSRFAAVVRWLHIYVSLLAFTSLVFFGITGITLNHPTWFGVEAQTVTEHEGELPQDWLPPVAAARGDEPADAEAGVDKLAIAEHLRATHSLRGAVSEFRVDEYECLVLFKGPGYSADVVAQRDSRKYRATVTQMGIVAIMNDLHKGRDTGASWSVVIDVVSILTVFLSITGLILIFYLKRKRFSGIVTTVVGTVLLVAIALWLIPQRILGDYPRKTAERISCPAACPSCDTISRSGAYNVGSVEHSTTVSIFVPLPTEQ